MLLGLFWLGLGVVVDETWVLRVGASVSPSPGQSPFLLSRDQCCLPFRGLISGWPAACVCSKKRT